MILLPTLSYEDALKLSSPTFVDIRSREEFDRDHIPGAVHVPLFDNAERCLIGTLYHREGVRQAIEKGMEIAEKKVQTLIARFMEVLGQAACREEWKTRAQRLDSLFSTPMNVQEEFALERVAPSGAGDARKDAIVVYCFRGGLRSRAFVYFLREAGIETLHLTGGYKGFRRFVREQLDAFPLPPIITLQGLTGAGKTRILQGLSKRFPGCVIDLEDLAGHRSSILGAVGKTPRTKKMFDSLLLERIYGSSAPFFLVEGESRKIGNIEIPLNLYRAMERGIHILAEAPVRTRARMLVEEYVKEETMGELLEGFEFLRERMGKKPWGILIRLFQQGKYEEAAEVLLEKYYDPLYQRTLREKAFHLRVNSMDIPEAVNRISAFVNDFLSGDRTRGSHVSRVSRPSAP